MFGWMAVQTQITRVMTHVVSRSIVPRPVGDLAKGGSEAGAARTRVRAERTSNDIFLHRVWGGGYERA